VWDDYLHQSKSTLPKGPGLSINQLEERDPIAIGCVREVLREQLVPPVRQRKKPKTRKAVYKELAKLLCHLRGEGTSISAGDAKDKLLKHLQQIQQTEGTVQTEMAKVLNFFGETEETLRTFELFGDRVRKI